MVGVAAAAVVVVLCGALCLFDLDVGRGADLEDVDLEANALAGERVVGVDEQRIRTHLEDAHEELAVGSRGDHLDTWLELLAALELEAFAIDLEHAVGLVRTEGVFGLGHDGEVRATSFAGEAALESRQDLAVAVNVTDRDALAVVGDLRALLVEERVGDRDVRVGSDGKRRFHSAAGVFHARPDFKERQVA
jgi:hypothetical protein